MADPHGIHYYHKRKKSTKKVKDSDLKKFVDKSIYIVALFGPLMTIPQLLKIWVDQNATGVSALSWSGYLIAALFWLFYGILHKEKPIILTNILWVVLEVFIVIGTLIYG